MNHILALDSDLQTTGKEWNVCDSLIQRSPLVTPTILIKRNTRPGSLACTFPTYLSKLYQFLSTIVIDIMICVKHLAKYGVVEAYGCN